MLNINWNPVTKKCDKIFAKGNQCILGISPFNSKFTVDYIQSLYQSSIKNFKNICFYIPDEPAVYTLIALSYEKKTAQNKVKRQCNYLINKIYRALEELGLSRDSISQKLLTHSFLNENESFITMKDLVYSLYSTNYNFRYGCIKTTEQVLSNQKEFLNLTEDSVQIAVNYFLMELPIFLNGSKILNVTSCNFCYHYCPDFLEELFLFDKYNLVGDKNSFVEIEVSEN